MTSCHGPFFSPNMEIINNKIWIIMGLRFSKKDQKVKNSYSSRDKVFFSKYLLAKQFGGFSSSKSFITEQNLVDQNANNFILVSKTPVNEFEIESD